MCNSTLGCLTHGGTIDRGTYIHNLQNTRKKIGKVYFIKVPSSIRNISLDLKRKKKRRLQYKLSLVPFKNFNVFQQDALLTNNKDILENCFTFANIFINMLFKDGIKPA